jgi:hypothetical protein
VGCRSNMWSWRCSPEATVIVNQASGDAGIEAVVILSYHIMISRRGDR